MNYQKTKDNVLLQIIADFQQKEKRKKKKDDVIDKTHGEEVLAR